MSTNDNDPVAGGSPTDAHGHAALLLVESLMHGLCENATLTASDAIEIADRAANVQGEQAEAADGAAVPLWRSHALLSSIAASFRLDGDEAILPVRPPA